MSVPDEENLFGWEDDYEDSTYSTNQENSFIMPSQNSEDPDIRPNKKQKISVESDWTDRPEFSSFMDDETSIDEIATASQQRKSVANLLLFSQVSISINPVGNLL